MEPSPVPLISCGERSLLAVSAWVCTCHGTIVCVGCTHTHRRALAQTARQLQCRLDGGDMQPSRNPLLGWEEKGRHCFSVLPSLRVQTFLKTVTSDFNPAVQGDSSAWEARWMWCGGNMWNFRHTPPRVNHGEGDFAHRSTCTVLGLQEEKKMDYKNIKFKNEVDISRLKTRLNK